MGRTDWRNRVRALAAAGSVPLPRKWDGPLAAEGADAVPRFVNISSETVPGFFFPERPFLPDYAPVDEEHPIRPQDPYALAKHFGEQLCDAAVRRSDIRVISLRPTHVQHPGNYERDLGAQVRDASHLSPNLWSCIDSKDLAIANPDNVGGRDFAQVLREHYGDQIELRALDRRDSSGISTAKVQRMIEWSAKRSWRDHLDAQGRAIDRGGSPVLTDFRCRTTGS